MFMLIHRGLHRDEAPKPGPALPGGASPSAVVRRLGCTASCILTPSLRTKRVIAWPLQRLARVMVVVSVASGKGRSAGVSDADECQHATGPANDRPVTG